MLFFVFEDSVSKQCSALSDLGLHCLHMSHKKDASLIWVKKAVFYFHRMTLMRKGRQILQQCWHHSRCGEESQW